MTYDDTTRDAALTAYALGELSPDEAAEVEARLEHDTAAREQVEQIRATAGLLERALATEMMDEVVAPAVAGRIGPPHRSHWTLAAAAAVVVGGIMAGVWLVQDEPRQVAMEPAPVNEPAKVLSAEEQDAVDRLTRDTMRAVADKKYGAAVGLLRQTLVLDPQNEIAAAALPRVEALAAEKEGGAYLRYQRGRATFPEPEGDAPSNVLELLDAQDPAPNLLAGRDSHLLPTDDGFGGSAAPTEGSEGGSDLRGNVSRLTSLYQSRVHPTQDPHLGVRVGSPASAVPQHENERMYAPEALRRAQERMATAGDAAFRVLPQEDFYHDRVPADGLDRFAPPNDREAYDRIVDNPFLRPSESPMSTFSVDVDTASYANVRRFLSNGQMPPPDAVRIEEFINYFQYRYPRPESPDVPFAADIAVASAPWNPKHRLVRIGLQAVDIDPETRPGANLVFLVDVSGSMNAPDKLPLVQQGLRTLTARLDERDRVAMVVYAGSSGVVLDATSGSDHETIRRAIDQLRAAGSTNGAAGIKEAYDLARESFREGGVNRVILATDGDFNVGITNRGQLTRLIEEQAEHGIYLTILGFGTGNLQDATMEELSNKGDGFYAYVDSEREAERVLGERMLSTVQAVAKDVKVQVEFNPAKVGAYRLIGYSNRLLEDRDFNDDTKDAGDTGAGHQVTALYEIIPPAEVERLAGLDAERTRKGLQDQIDELTEALKANAQAGAVREALIEKLEMLQRTMTTLDERTAGALAPPVDDLKYQQKPAAAPAMDSDELMTVKLRWKAPDEAKVQGTSEKVEWPVVDAGRSFEEADGEFQFAATVAGFGMLLRESQYVGQWTWEDLEARVEPMLEEATRARLTSEGVRRYVEFPELVQKAARLAK